VSEADEALRRSRARFQQLIAHGASRQSIHTAECDVFGAKKTALLARAAVNGSLVTAIATASPAEIQIIKTNEWKFVAWPGEFFVEHGLAKARSPNTFVVTLAKGELQGLHCNTGGGRRWCI
jgi:neutral ceramidase